jgi:1,3,6,8-tetrahydroxynaphthalene synthase
MEQLAPELKSVAAERGWNAADLDFYVIHAGGPRILDDLALFLGVNAAQFDYSRATLREYGNIASCVVLDVLRRLFEAGRIADGARGIIAGFGPGITAEITLGTWATHGTTLAEDVQFEEEESR